MRLNLILVAKGKKKANTSWVHWIYWEQKYSSSLILESSVGVEIGTRSVRQEVEWKDSIHHPLKNGSEFIYNVISSGPDPFLILTHKGSLVRNDFWLFKVHVLRNKWTCVCFSSSPPCNSNKKEDKIIIIMCLFCLKSGQPLNPGNLNMDANLSQILFRPSSGPQLTRIQNWPKYWILITWFLYLGSFEN